MKYTLLAFTAVLLVGGRTYPNVPPPSRAERPRAETVSPLAAPGVTVEDDGCSSVLITVRAYGLEANEELLARAKKAGAEWRRLNPGCRTSFTVAGVGAENGRRVATWSTLYCRYTLDECDD